MTEEVDEFRRALFEAGFLTPTSTPGVYHRSFEFIRLFRGVESYVSAAGRDVPRRQMYLSPILADSALTGSGYLLSFPNLVGVLTSFTRPETDLPELINRVESGGDWPALLSSDGLALAGAACHHVYPTLENCEVPSDGVLYEVQSVCHRHEPSEDPARMQSFSMHEFVLIGSEENALAHRDLWLQRGAHLLEQLGLTIETVPANDPFFGRAGKLMKASQRERAAKFELISPISSPTPGAISSGNFHGDHFGTAFNISLSDGGPAHSACFGFGLERITLALLYRHGLDVSVWPPSVLSNLNVAPI